MGFPPFWLLPDCINHRILLLPATKWLSMAQNPRQLQNIVTICTNIKLNLFLAALTANLRTAQGQGQDQDQDDVAIDDVRRQS